MAPETARTPGVFQGAGVQSTRMPHELSPAPEPRPRDRSSRFGRVVRYAVFGTLLVHAIVIGLLLYAARSGPAPELGPGPPEPAGGSETAQADEPASAAALAGDRDALRERVSEELAQAESMSDAEKQAALERGAETVAEMDPDDVHVMAYRVESALDLDDTRAWSPDPQASGPMDWNTAVLYDLRAPGGEAAGRGGTVEMVWVDARGVSETLELDRATLPPAMERLIPVYEAASAHPNMRRLLMTATRAAYARWSETVNHEEPGTRSQEPETGN